MKQTFGTFTLATLLLTYSLPALANHSLWTEGDSKDGKAAKENAKLLKSVFQISVDKKSYLLEKTQLIHELGIENTPEAETMLSDVIGCTSTLVSESILLTARHCVLNQTEGSLVTLLSDQTYHIAGLAAQKDQFTQTQTILGHESHNTDIALVLLKPDDCDHSEMKGIDPVKVVADDTPSLSVRALIAGYGYGSWKATQAGILRAGYNQWAVNKFGPSANGENEKFYLEQFDQLGFTPTDLALVGSRDEKTSFQVDSGTEFSFANTSSQQTIIPENQALSMHGDSGGPAFSQDSNGTWYQVGVTSEVSKFFLHPVERVEITGPGEQTFLSINLPPMNRRLGSVDSNGKAALQQVYLQGAGVRTKIELRKLGYLSSTGTTALTNFKVDYIQPRLALSTYASMAGQLNQKFFRENLKLLEQKRDSLKICAANSNHSKVRQAANGARANLVQH